MLSFLVWSLFCILFFKVQFFFMQILDLTGIYHITHSNPFLCVNVFLFRILVSKLNFNDTHF